MISKITGIFLSIVLVASLFGSCVYKKGIDYKSYPDRDMPVYDDAVVFEYEEKDDSFEITFGSSDDVDDIIKFYQEFFVDEEIFLLEEKEKKDSYKAEGEIEDYTFEIEIEESSGKLEKYYDSVTTILLEPIDGNEKSASKFVSSESLTAETIGGSSITFSEYDITEDTKVDSKKVEIPFELSDEVSSEDVKITAYDYTVENVEEFIGLIEIKIPYDESMIEPGESVAACVSAGYYNEKTDEVEPVIYDLDEEEKKVIITTDHLSTYCVFTFKNAYKRTATVQLLDYYDMEDVIRFSGVDANDLLIEVAQNGGKPGELCYEVGFNAITESLNISGAAATFLTEAITTNESLSSLSDMLGTLGNAAAFAQFAVDIAKGDSEQLYMNTIKNVLGYVIGAIAPLAAVGVFAIDYSLNMLGAQIRINEEKIQEGYDNWYKDYEGKQEKHISVRMYEDVEQLYGQYKRGEINDLGQAIEGKVREYTNLVWNAKDYDTFFGTTYVSSEYKKELGNTAYNKIMRGTMQNVFSRAERKIAYYQKKAFLTQLKQTRDFFNQKINFTITEVLPEEGQEYMYANHIIRFAELSKQAVKSTWTGRLNGKASGKGTFTLLGYLQAGCPNTINIYEPDADVDADAPILSVPLNFAFKDIDIEIMQNVNLLVGTWVHIDKSNDETRFPSIMQIFKFYPDMTVASTLKMGNAESFNSADDESTSIYKYSIEGDTLTLYFDDPRTLRFKVEDNELYLSAEGYDDYLMIKEN